MLFRCPNLITTYFYYKLLLLFSVVVSPRFSCIRYLLQLKLIVYFVNVKRAHATFFRFSAVHSTVKQDPLRTMLVLR